MNDRFWTMKVVVEKVRIFICVMKNEIPLFTEVLCLGNFHFPAQATSHSQSVYAGHICCCRVQYQKKPLLHLILAPSIETCYRFQANLSIRSACLSLDCGNLTLDHQLV